MMTERTATSFKPIGRPGIAHSGGRLRHDDFDLQWRGVNRDRTIVRMQNDPVIGAILHGIEMLIRGVDWTVEPANHEGVDEQAAKDVAQFVEGCFDDMEGFWPGDTLSAMVSYIPWGWSLMEMVYKRRSGPEAGDPTRRSKYDDGRIGWRQWSIRPQATRESWVFDDAGSVAAMVQRDPHDSTLHTIPLDRCIHIVYSSRFNSPEGWTPLRPAFASWYFKTNIQQIEAIGIERDLAGLPVAYVPSHWRPGETMYESVREIVTGVRNDEQAGVLLPSEFDENGNRLLSFALMSTGGARAFDTDVIVRRYANEIVTVFLANVMRTGQDGIGALALSETQSGLFQQAIAAHLDIMADAINTQAIPQLVRLNGIDAQLAPMLRHGRLDSADLGQFGQYLSSLVSTGLLLDTPQLRAFAHEIAGLPVANLPTQEEIDAQRSRPKVVVQEAPDDDAIPDLDQPDPDEATDDPEDDETPDEAAS
jgi:hypothetical protein